MAPGGAAPLPVAEAYRLWAATYDEETAVSLLDEEAVRTLTPPLTGARLLDAGCGTARRLLPAVAAGAWAVGIDFVREMLGVGRDSSRELPLAQGDVRALPFADAAFDVAWCRLVAGHLPTLEACYAELSRVLRAGGCLVVSDFHPAAARRGHVRTFRDASGTVRLIEHHTHSTDEHETAAGAAGFRRVSTLHCEIGPQLVPLYQAADAMDRYRRDRGLPLVLALRFAR